MDIDYYKQMEPLFGAWHIVKEIGKGGFGTVYEIERMDYGHVYKAALKTITIPNSEADIKNAMLDGLDYDSTSEYFESIVKEMTDEFSLMDKVKGHSNIVSYLDHLVIRHKEGIGWDILIRMEYLTPLKDYLTVLAQQGREMPESEVYRLGIDICKALEVCEKHSIVHRDIKIDNIFLSDNGDFKLGDFGIARTIEKTSGASTKVGTRDYMAPEIIQGKKYGSNVDIYSLGHVLYRLLNHNRLPFMPFFPYKIYSSDRDKMIERRINGEQISDIPGQSGAVNRLLQKMCAFHPKERYQSAAQVRMELEGIKSEAEKNRGESVPEKPLEAALETERSERSDNREDLPIQDAERDNSSERLGSMDIFPPKTLDSDLYDENSRTADDEMTEPHIQEQMPSTQGDVEEVVFPDWSGEGEEDGISVVESEENGSYGETEKTTVKVKENDKWNLRESERTGRQKTFIAAGVGIAVVVVGLAVSGIFLNHSKTTEPSVADRNEKTVSEVTEDKMDENDITEQELIDEQEENEEETKISQLHNPIHHCDRTNGGEKDYTEWSYVTFGSYPQSEITDEGVIKQIDEALSNNGQYVGDVVVNDIKYRKADVKNGTWFMVKEDAINIMSYEDENSEVIGHAFAGETFQWYGSAMEGWTRIKYGSGTGYVKSESVQDIDVSMHRFFKWEPIRWKVLDTDGEKAFLVAESGLDCQRYNEEWEDATWESCTLRKWLNGYEEFKDFGQNGGKSFYDTAFGEEEKKVILETMIENNNNPKYGTPGGKSTNDKIFLLSLEEVMNSGFCPSASCYSSTRAVSATDYGRTMGATVFENDYAYASSFWWLRSPGSSASSALRVNTDGSVYLHGDGVGSDMEAIVPALYLNLKSATWEIVDGKNESISANEIFEEGPSESDKDSVALMDFLGIPGLDLQYIGNTVTNIYPQKSEGNGTGSFFAMRSTPGNNLLVLKFHLQNISNEDCKVDLVSKKVRFSVCGDTIEKTNMQITMLDNDLSSYQGTLTQGAGTDVVLVAEIPETKASNLGTLELSVYCDGEFTSFKL